jgi:hypothetical protein
MPTLFADQTADAVRMSLQRLRDENEWQHGRHLTELEDYYVGGERTLQYLVRFQGEQADKWALRRKNYASANYVRVFADELISGAFGGDTKRSFEGITDPQAKVLNSIWSWNEMPILSNEIGQGVIVFGDGWVNIDWSEQAETLNLLSVHPSDLMYTLDPTNRRKLLEVIERRYLDEKKGKKLYEYWVWTDQAFYHLNEDLVVIAEGENDRGTIPYVRYKGRSLVGNIDGLSYIEDQVTLQKQLINRVSQLGLIIQYQAGSQLVLKNFDQEAVKMGVTSAILLGDNGEAFFLTPDGKIAEVSGAIEDDIKRMFDVGGVPIELHRGTIDASGVALEIRLRPMTKRIKSIRNQADMGDKELIRKVCLIGSRFGLPLPEMVEPIVEYDSNVIPRDEMAEKQADLELVNNSPRLMSLVDFHIKWTPGIETEKEALALIEKLKAEEGPPAPPPETGNVFGPPGGGILFP